MLRSLANDEVVDDDDGVMDGITDGVVVAKMDVVLARRDGVGGIVDNGEAEEAKDMREETGARDGEEVDEGGEDEGAGISISSSSL